MNNEADRFKIEHLFVKGHKDRITDTGEIPEKLTLVS